MNWIPFFIYIVMILLIEYDKINIYYNIFYILALPIYFAPTTFHPSP